jgi:hypothetical protein
MESRAILRGYTVHFVPTIYFVSTHRLTSVLFSSLTENCVYFPFRGGMEPSPLLLGPLFGLVYQLRMMKMVSVSSQWNEWQGKLKYSEKTYPIVSLSNINPT